MSDKRYCVYEKDMFPADEFGPDCEHRCKGPQDICSFEGEPFPTTQFADDGEHLHRWPPHYSTGELVPSTRVETSVGEVQVQADQGLHHA